jgi:adenylate cyclase
VYELICRIDEATQQQIGLCADFAAALGAYRAGAWEEAIARFYGCLKHESEDGPSHFCITLCEEYKEQPPEEAWNGVVRLTKK